MSHFDEVTQKYSTLNFMNEARALRMRELVGEARDLLEIGFWKGKSSAYFAAMLEDRGGEGHLTTIDRKLVENRSPNIRSVLADLGLGHRVTPVFADRSYTWELAKWLQSEPRPSFDFCYFDGGHTWDMTALGLVLVDMLLRPGALIVVDDLNWTINGSIGRTPSEAENYAGYGEDEKAAESVRLAFHTMLPRLGYVEMREDRFSWGIARKPLQPST